MVMNFEKLSENIITIIGEVLKDKKLINYIGWNGDNPSQQSIDPLAIAPKGASERIFPYPFDVNFKEDIRTELHIYYPNLKFESNGHAGRTVVLFDIVVHKSVWLLTDNGKKIIRPYEIANLILNIFKDKNIKNLGKLHFVEADHTVVNEEFEGFRLIATATEF